MKNHGTMINDVPPPVERLPPPVITSSMPPHHPPTSEVSSTPPLAGAPSSTPPLASASPPFPNAGKKRFTAHTDATTSAGSTPTAFSTPHGGGAFSTPHWNGLLPDWPAFPTEVPVRHSQGASSVRSVRSSGSSMLFINMLMLSRGTAQLDVLRDAIFSA